MPLLLIGLNHRTAPLGLLERMTVSPAALPKALHDLSRRPHLREVVVLSTCNRTEVYVAAERFHDAYAETRDFLAEHAFLAPEDFADHLYTHHDDAVAGHLFSVAAGLDSAVVGESEILGQVGDAWAAAQQEGAAGSALHLLFRHAHEVGKRARTETAIGRHVASVSQAAIAMADARIGGLVGRRVLVLGAGAMGEGMAGGLAAAGAAEVLVANRTWPTACDVASRIGGRAVALADLADALVDVDLLLTSTGAASVMVEHAELAAVADRRAGRQLVIVDVAVPRDVDPSASELPGVTLLDMDDLRAFAASGMENRRREIGAVRTIVDEETVRYAGVASAREVAPLVTALRDRAEALRTAEIARHRARLAELSPEQRAAVEALTRGLVAKLLHDPTVRVKDSAGTPGGERLADALRELYGLE